MRVGSASEIKTVFVFGVFENSTVCKCLSGQCLDRIGKNYLLEVRAIIKCLICNNNGGSAYCTLIYCKRFGRNEKKCLISIVSEIEEISVFFLVVLELVASVESFFCSIFDLVELDRFKI